MSSVRELAARAMVLVMLASLTAHRSPLFAQSPATRLAQATDSAVFRAHLGYLADDLLEGRAPATRGGELAAKYIAAQFGRLGLEPAGDSGSFFHHVPIIALTPDPSMAVTQKSGPVALRYRDDFVLWSMRNQEQVAFGGNEAGGAGNAVFVGYGIVAPEWKWNDYAGLDVKGKIVLCLVNDPGLRDSSIFRGRILTYYGRWTYKIEEAQRQGAAGILMIHTTESATYPWTTVTGSWTGEQVRLEKPAGSLLVAGWIRDTTLAPLFTAGGLDLNQMMAQAATNGFRAVPLPFGFSGSVKSAIRRSATSNVVARLTGSGALGKEAVMIGGHYDHLGVRAPVHGDSIYNGAEDNASGTAAVLTAAEAFVRSKVTHRRSIVFIAFSAEESGLLGSQAFAENPTLPLKNLVAVLNMDVTNLYGRTRDIAALGLDQSSLGPVFVSAAAAEGLRTTVDSGSLIQGSFFRSDHFSFARAGVPALSLESGGDYVGKPQGWGEQQHQEYTANRYHQPQDEILPWFSMAGTIQQIRVILRTALAVANAPTQPTWSAGSEFRAAGEARVSSRGSWVVRRET